MGETNLTCSTFENKQSLAKKLERKVKFTVGGMTLQKRLSVVLSAVFKTVMFGFSHRDFDLSFSLEINPVSVTYGVKKITRQINKMRINRAK